jgi:hypothetical protein
MFPDLGRIEKIVMIRLEIAKGVHHETAVVSQPCEIIEQPLGVEAYIHLGYVFL